MSKLERTELINFIANNPKAGDVITGTGGVRKVRFAKEGKGKSGSFRVVYYFYNTDNPIILFTVFGKGEKSNINNEDKNELRKVVTLIKKEMKS